ncbi:N-acetyltransferase [Chitinophaga silvisoli]|uniref:N-acetyltransferase n=2 Tax=Chitinophaga silvisoli TaxID=2291814 RepID=A0A3E1NTM4_9BACT|nr:N-acetyltransferase [Chitinophaga silvisoli]
MPDVVIKTGKEQMDLQTVHQFLSQESYWAKGIPFEMVADALSHSYCTGAFLDGQQIGFGRLITDYTTFAWFADFFVLPEYHGRGVAKQMLTHILSQPWTKRLRRKMLATKDAHTLYEKFEFTALASPDRIMEIFQPDIHLHI